MLAVHVLLVDESLMTLDVTLLRLRHMFIQQVVCETPLFLLLQLVVLVVVLQAERQLGEGLEGRGQIQQQFPPRCRRQVQEALWVIMPG